MGKLLTYEEAGIEFGGLTVCQVKRLIKKHGLVFVELSPHDRKIDTDDIAKYIESKRMKVKSKES